MNVQRTAPILFVLLVLATVGRADTPTIEWETVDSDLWIPIPPEAPADRARFDDDPPLDTRTWTWLAPGDTLRFVVRGEGTLRVETRPNFRTDAPRRRYRLGVFTAPDTERKLIRRSAFEAFATVDGDTVRVGEVDRWETPMLSGSEEILVTLREERSAPLLARVLVRGDVQRPADGPHEEPTAAPVVADTSSDDRPWELEIAAAAIGYDGNAYLTPADSSDVRDAWYWPVEVDADLDVYDGERLEIEAQYRLDLRQYDDPILDETRHLVRLRQTLDDLDVMGETRVRFEQRLRTRDRTFFGRGEFEEFETASDAIVGQRRSLADRFDWVEGRLRAEVRVEPTRDWTLDLQGTVLRRDYVEDFDDEPDIWSLDQWRSGLEFAAERELRDDWAVEFETGFEAWNYDEKFSRDPTGALVRDLPTRLHRWPLSLAVGHDPSDGLAVEATLAALWTDDRRQDYWSRVTWSATFEAAWDADRWSIESRVRASVTDYENATVDLDDPTTPIRTKDSLRFGVEGTYRWTEAIDTVLRYDHESLDNDNRRFAYDRDTVEAVLRFTW